MPGLAEHFLKWLSFSYLPLRGAIEGDTTSLSLIERNEDGRERLLGARILEGTKRNKNTRVLRSRWQVANPK